MKTLMFADDFYHPGQVPTDGVAPLKEKGFCFDIITNANDFKPEMLSGYNAVLMCKCDEISAQDRRSWKTAQVQDSLSGYVEKGGGLLVVHTGTVAGENTEKLDRLIGCKFGFHPKDTPVTVQPLKPHPVTEGVNMFREIDEHYRLEILADDIDIIMASYSPAQGSSVQYEEEPYFNSPEWLAPAGYVRTQKKGRICVLTPGHHLRVWHNSNFQRVLENALNWIGGRK